ncbi:MAG: efflux RND transporter periplasmic adaptor subunit [Anaerolineales bacterium]|nr:efflux RND transporter periplasmic adaptor subunit [Anaerolineales bacterium]
MKNLLTKKWLWISIIVLAVAGFGGYSVYNNYFAPTAEESETPQMQTAVARLGELVIFATGSGQIVPASQIGLGFDESGTLIELNVSVGDKVQAGDILARLQTQESPESIAASIADAELAVVQAQQSLDDLYENAEISRVSAMNDIAVYAQAVRDAQYQLENYTVPIFLQDLGTVEAVDLMKAELDAASAAFEPYKYLSPNNATRLDLLEDLNIAQSNYDSAVKRLNYEYELQVAQANLEKARADYDKYKDGPAADELALAEAELANAQAKLALEEEAQAALDLVAPMGGVIMAVDATVGEVVSATPIITLADLQEPMLEVYIDETDLDKIAVGYAAEVTFDALPGRVFSGKVTTVSPGLETVSNVQAVKAVVLLDSEGLDENLTLPVGLNASVDIIAGRAENAVLVPVEALRDLGDGEYAVFVVENGEPVLRIVEVGLIDITYAEIISGLQAGEVVSTGIVQAQ